MKFDKLTKKVAFIYDDRLSHDRKRVFSNIISILKPKYNFEILPATMSESELVEHLDSNEYSLILLPWYKYLSWKKVESHFGSLRLQGTTIAGYFADTVLPYEFSQMPSFHRMILLDFYRFELSEIEMILTALVHLDSKAGFSGLFPKSTPVFFSDWYSNDSESTRCIDGMMKTALLRSSHWSDRVHSIRLFMTALWTLCFENRHSFPAETPCAHLEIAEIHKRLAIKLSFETHSLTLKHVMDYLWPNGPNNNQTMSELSRHADFLRIHHFPESHSIEITAFFTPQAPAVHYPNEVRGFWIEPMKVKFLRTAEEDFFTKNFPMNRSSEERITDQLSEVLEKLRGIYARATVCTAEERVSLDHHFLNIRFLTNEIEKKVAEKKKAA